MDCLQYSEVAECYAKLESTSGRNEMAEILAALLRDTPVDELPMLAYLTQGKLKPDYEGVELGLAEKTSLRTLATASGFPLTSSTRPTLRSGTSEPRPKSC